MRPTRRTILYSLMVFLGLAVIQTPLPSIATPRNAQSVRLVFETSWVDQDPQVYHRENITTLDGQGKSSGKATYASPSGTRTFEWDFPETIGSGGATLRITVKAKPHENQGLDTSIDLIGINVKETDRSLQVYVSARYPQGEQVNTQTFTIIPAAAYDPQNPPVFRVRCAGSLDMLFRYTVEQASNRGGALEYDTDRPGQDYKNFNLPQARPELCQAECSSDSKCKSFTYVKPGVQGSSARCWLKSTVPAPVKSSCCVSGIL